MKKMLIIQTAFLGDVILATPLIEKLHRYFPLASIDFLLRKGTESLLTGHPHLRRILVWEKKKNKYLNLLRLTKQVRAERYDLIINLHRFFSSGLIIRRSGATHKAGFDKNPFSNCYTRKFIHEIGNGKHEVNRNLELIAEFTDNEPELPVLYPSVSDFEKTTQYKNLPYVCIAPASIWYTKQYPVERWAELIGQLDPMLRIYLLGGPGDWNLCCELSGLVNRDTVVNLAGKLSVLESAALMKDSKMNYTNDSSPLHLASAMNAPVRAVFCSTVTDFGFGPLSNNSGVVEVREKLPCRPCGLHGHRKCPENHFRCAKEIITEDLLV